MAELSRRNLGRRLSILFNRMVMPSSSYAVNGYQQLWKFRWFESFNLSMVFVATILFVYAVPNCIHRGLELPLLAISATYLGLLFFAIVKSISYKIRIFGVLTVLYVTAGLASVYAHPVLGLVITIGSSVMAAIIIGVRAGYLFMAINFLLYTSLVISKQVVGLEYLEFDKYVMAVVFHIAVLLPLSELLKSLNYSAEKEARLKNIIKDHEQKIIEAKEHALQSDSLKTAFLSNMSHEIRTPMNAILGFSNLLSHKNIGGEEKREFINLIRLNGKNLMTLVEDLIDVSKIDSGQLQIRNKPTRLHDVLMQVYESYLDDLTNRGLTQQIKLYLKEGISDCNVKLLTDANRLRQILMHIVGNAIKFTDRGYVEFGYEHKNEHFLEFYVKDTGIGVSEDKRDFVFERFSKAADLSPKLYGGTGIGLSLAKDLVNLMGGDIWLESEPNIGTTFYFTLPFQECSDMELRSERCTKKPLVYNWSGKTILVAEDEEDNFRYLEVALSISNASLIWARNGQEAVDIIKSSQLVDLVLMDIKMPMMDGYEATRRIKRINPNIPIIAQTAYAMSEEREKSIIIGCDDYIAKPINYEDLLSTVNRFMPSVEIKKELISV